MLFKRANITSAGMTLVSRANAGTGEISNLRVQSIATDANTTLTVADLAGGVVMFTGFSAGRNVTTPTAALIIAAAADMDIGDSFSFTVSIIPAFAGTLVAGTGVTLVGRTAIPASGSCYTVCTKTSDTTVTWTSL